MTKKEMHQEINKRFFKFVESHYPEYDICDYGDGGRVILDYYTGSDNTIEYHLSRHTLDCYNFACEKTKEDMKEMEAFLELLEVMKDLKQ